VEIGVEIAMDLDRGVDNRVGDVVEVSHCSSCKCPSAASPRLRVKESKCAVRRSESSRQRVNDAVTMTAPDGETAGITFMPSNTRSSLLRRCVCA